jgi:hypothetical protein
MPEPGDRLIDGILNGQIDGQRLANLLWAGLPSLPHETGGLPLPIPRLLATQMFGARQGEAPGPTTFLPKPVVEQGMTLVPPGAAARPAETHHSNPGNPYPAEPIQATQYTPYAVPTSQMPFNGSKHTPGIGESHPITVYRPPKQL